MIYLTCDKCSLKYRSDFKHCCGCSSRYRDKHCAKCHLTYNSDKIHCCDCVVSYPIVGPCWSSYKVLYIHCCKCKISTPYHHCCICKMCYDPVYHGNNHLNHPAHKRHREMILKKHQKLLFDKTDILDEIINNIFSFV